MTTVSLNMVHQSAVGVSCLSWYCLWILVKADKLSSPLVPIVFCHEPPAVLYRPSWWTLVCPWHHNVFGASAHLAHSTGNVVVMECRSRKSLTATYLIFCSIQVCTPSIAGCGLWVVLAILHCTDVVGSASMVVIVTSCCDAVIHCVSPIHRWTGGPPPPDVGHAPRSRSARRPCFALHTWWSLWASTACLPIPTIPPVSPWSAMETCSKQWMALCCVL